MHVPVVDPRELDVGRARGEVVVHDAARRALARVLLRERRRPTRAPRTARSAASSGDAPPHRQLEPRRRRRSASPARATARSTASRSARSASRSACPAGTAYAVDCSRTRTVIASPGTTGTTRSWPVAVREVEHAARDQRRAAVGRDVAQPRGDERDRAGRRSARARPPRGRAARSARRAASRSQHSDAPSSGRWSAGAVGRPAVPAPHARLQPGELQPAQRCAAPRPSASTARLDVRRRPRRIGDPAPRPLGAARDRPDPLLHVRDQRRLVEEAVLDALERVVEEAHDLLEEPDRRARARPPPGPCAPTARSARAPAPPTCSTMRSTMSR